ncbi:hypothetical protein A3A69_00900 [candidate division WWE3 bacterium RIFCSPLOWO2_01_FULL_37_15]|uniref:AI-2E family transporter n=1 Tax=candidate division WWE3 bacterium RIFCSPLOWO2_01_FULL_37_15 TaxID=1802622 RepID=A0A1F4UT32_UNCKA|nr:MAG: hypothetical protein A3A69_00900 [candidate division WWE3 bacterium RIFCSPLOWO2_01_FULL_37_15]
MDKEIVISIKTVLFTLLLILVSYVVFRMGPILAIICIAALLMISLENSVQTLMKQTFLNRPLPRSLAVILVYAMLILLIFVVLTLIVPPVITQAQTLLTNLSFILEKLQLTESADISLTSLLPQATSVSSGFLNVTISIFNNVATFFTLLVISIYMSLDWPNLKKRFMSVVPKKFKDMVSDTIVEVEMSVGHWLKGEAFLMLVVGTMSFLGLSVLQVPYPLALGLVSGILEAVPMIGPLLSAIVASIIGFSVSPVKGLMVVGLFIIIQQLENNLIVPKVMGRVSGFSPLVILLALLIGSNFFGIVGAILAIPTTIILVIVVKRVLRYTAE